MQKIAHKFSKSYYDYLNTSSMLRGCSDKLNDSVRNLMKCALYEIIA
ncbi:hypothetical protein GN241_13355 [Rhodobacteraceae bacterium IMCC1335]